MVHSLGCVDLKPYPQIFTRILHILVHPRWTEPIFYPLVFRVWIPGVGVPIGHLEMDRLILFVLGSRPAHAGQDVKGDLVVGFGVFDPPALVGAFGGGVVRPLGFQGPWRSTFEHVRFETGVKNAPVETERGMKRGSIIPDIFQFLPDDTSSQRVFIVI